ncbi:MULTISPECIES: alkaline phosphatase family protein [Chitinophagaceae]
MGHRYGDSPEFYKGIELADQRIGMLYKAVQYRQKQFGEDWMLIVTTDHGRDPKQGWAWWPIGQGT